MVKTGYKSTNRCTNNPEFVGTKHLQKYMETIYFILKSLKSLG